MNEAEEEMRIAKIKEQFAEWNTTNNGQLWRYKEDGTVEYMD